MLNPPQPMLPIERVNWQALLPTYPYRFYGSGYLYCVRCAHFICLVSVSENEVLCSDCAKVLANAMSHNSIRREKP